MHSLAYWREKAQRTNMGQTMRNGPSFPRVLCVCILLSLTVGFSLLILEALFDPDKLKKETVHLLVNGVTMAAVLLAAIGGIIGCVAYTVMDLTRRKDR
jgi:hypothetical protein